MSVLNRKTLEKIMPFIRAPAKENECYCYIFGTRYSLRYIYEDFEEEYCIEIDDYCEDDYTIKVRVHAREDEVEYEDFEWTSILFIKEFWEFYFNYMNN